MRVINDIIDWAEIRGYSTDEDLIPIYNQKNKC